MNGARRLPRSPTTKSLATLGVTSYVLGSAVATMPASLWMAKVGRRMGFMAGALINVGGCCARRARASPSAASRSTASRTAVIGIYTAIGLAIPLRGRGSRRAGGQGRGDLAGARRRHRRRLSRPGVGAARGRPVSRRRSSAGFVVLAAYAIAALAVQSRVHVPPPTIEERSGGGAAAVADRAAAWCSSSPALAGGAGLRAHEPADDGRRRSR